MEKVVPVEIEVVVRVWEQNAKSAHASPLAVPVMRLIASRYASINDGPRVTRRASCSNIDRADTISIHMPS